MMTVEATDHRDQEKKAPLHLSSGLWLESYMMQQLDDATKTIPGGLEELKNYPSEPHQLD